MGEFSPFKTIAGFISKEAKIACNPIISLQSLKSDQSQNDSNRAYRQTKPSGKYDGRSVLTTDTGDEKSEPAEPKITVSQCVLCKGNHESVRTSCPGHLVKERVMRR